MKDKQLLKKLVQKIKNQNRKDLSQKCVGFCKSNSKQYLFSLSGSKYDYNGKLALNSWCLSSDVECIYSELVKLFAGSSNRTVQQCHLTEMCKTQYDSVYATNQISSTTLGNMWSQRHLIESLPRLFSCVERKLMFCGKTNITHGPITIYVSQEPCILCEPFITKNVKIKTR